MSKVLLFGYFGEDNYGDDLLLWTAALRLAKQIEAGKADLTVLSAKPYPQFPVPAAFVPRLDLAKVKAAIRHSDIVCAPGGGLLQDSTSLKSLLYYLNIVRIAKAYGKPVLLLAQGIGPIKSQLGRLACSRVLRDLKRFSVRDRKSELLLRSIIGSRSEIAVTADFTFSLSTALRPEEGGRGPHSGKHEPVILICARDSGNPEIQLSQLSAALIHAGNLIEKPGLKYQFMPMHLGRDTSICNKLAERLDGEIIEPSAGNPITAFAAFDRASAVLSYRLHGCVVSALRSKPFVAISYDPKVESFAGTFNMQCFQSDRWDPQAVGKAIADAANNHFAERMQAVSSALTEASEADLNALLAALE